MDFKEICREWRKRRLPIINGIVYSSGDVDKIYIDYDENNYERILIHSGRTKVGLLFTNEGSFSDVNIYGTTSNEEKNLTVSYGGGSYGGDGFIVVESNESKIVWLAFFEDSNEFEQCEIKDRAIIVYNNLGEKWTFDIDMPSTLYIKNVS